MPKKFGSKNALDNFMAAKYQAHVWRRKFGLKRITVLEGMEFTSDQEAVRRYGHSCIQTEDIAEVDIDDLAIRLQGAERD